MGEGPCRGGHFPSKPSAAIAELERCVQALAQPPEVQLTLFQDFTRVGDELAIEFENALVACRSTLWETAPERRVALDALDAYLDELSDGDDLDFWWKEGSLFTDPQWSRIRELAASVLTAFAWPSQVPTKNGSTYVTAEIAVRSL